MAQKDNNSFRVVVPAAWKKAPLTKNKIRGMLPKVGDIRMEVATTKDRIQRGIPRRCRVVLVHRTHMWYMVEFDDGFRECYSARPWDMGTNGGVPR